jgi:hypothetical protein
MVKHKRSLALKMLAKEFGQETTGPLFRLAYVSDSAWALQKSRWTAEGGIVFEPKRRSDSGAAAIILRAMNARNFNGRM